MIALENGPDWNIDIIYWKCQSNPATTAQWLFFYPETTSSNFRWKQSLLFKHTNINGLSFLCVLRSTHRYNKTKPNYALGLLHSCLSLTLSERWKSTYQKMTRLRPVFSSHLSQPSTSLDKLHLPSLYVPLSVTLEPNYPPRTQRSYHRDWSCSSVHRAHDTGLRNSQHTCWCLKRRIDQVVASPSLI